MTVGGLASVPSEERIGTKHNAAVQQRASGIGEAEQRAEDRKGDDMFEVGIGLYLRPHQVRRPRRLVRDSRAPALARLRYLGGIWANYRNKFLLIFGFCHLSTLVRILVCRDGYEWPTLAPGSEAAARSTVRQRKRWTEGRFAQPSHSPG